MMKNPSLLVIIFSLLCIQQIGGQIRLADTESDFIKLVANQNVKIIRSLKDFDNIIRIKKYPFSKLDKQTSEEFKKDLIFKNNGLSSARIDIIQKKLTPKEFFLFMKEFGLSEKFVKDHTGYYCSGRGTCRRRVGHICTSNC